jgi:DNA invertase Pin-like site-specific DNA recombinase
MKRFLRVVPGDAISPRGRKPRRVVIAPCDLSVMRWVATAPTLPLYQVRRAKIVLAIAAGARTQQVARELGCDEATVWRICRRYEQHGLTGLLADGRRPA